MATNVSEKQTASIFRADSNYIYLENNNLFISREAIA
jgi:hypothetical protein